MGNDTITTDASGDQYYHYGRGDGRDLYVEGNGQNDWIVFDDDISLSDLSFEQVGVDLYIGLKQAGSTVSVTQLADHIRIASWSSHYTYQIEGLQFADGGTFALSNYQYHLGTASNDTIYGAGPKGWFDGGDGNDAIYGYSQAAGRNSSVSVQQHFRGGKGNDTITTDASGDQYYHFDRGDGQDTYIEGNGQNDWIVFGNGISLNDLYSSRWVLTSISA